MRLFACGQFSCSHIGVVPADVRTRGPIRRVACVQRRCWMTSSQTTPCGSGSRIALRLCGTTAVDVGCRHCERSEAIHGTSAMKVDCFAALAMTGLGTASRNQLGPSFPDVQLHIVDAPLGAGPESITTDGGYGFRARCCASPRNDGLGWFCVLQ